MIENKKNGFSIIEVLVALGLLSIVGIGATSMILNMMSSNDYVIMGNSALNLKSELTALLNDKRAWTATIADTATNPNATAQFACLRNSTDCAALTSTYPFTPKMITNNFFRSNYNPQTNPDQGFNKNGIVCATYSTTTPNDACPMQYTFTWQPLCPATGMCIDPPVRIRLIFNFSSTSKLTTLNPERYGNDNIIIGSNSSTYTESSCIIIGGVWNTATQTCTPPPLPSGTIVNVSCTSSAYTTSPVVCTPVVVPPVTGCGTLSGGSAPTCDPMTGSSACNCTRVIAAGYTTTLCTGGVSTPSGTCACPPSCPTVVGNTPTPANPVSPASYSTVTQCQCP